MTQTATSSSNATPLSRFARLGIGLNLKSGSVVTQSGILSRHQRASYTDDNESDWYIPYNGPYEFPKDVMHGRREGGLDKLREQRSYEELPQGDPEAYAGEENIYVRGSNNESTSGHGHSQTQIAGVSNQGPDAGPSAYTFGENDLNEERGRSRSRYFSGSSRYTESVRTFGGGGDNYSRLHPFATSPMSSPITSPRTRGNSNSVTASQQVRASVPSFLNLDQSGAGIGESPIPVQRVQSGGSVPVHGHGHGFLAHNHNLSHDTGSSQHRPAHDSQQLGTISTSTNRGSFASFWTFGLSSSRKSPPTATTVFSFAGRPSEETYLSRPSTSTHGTVLNKPHSFGSAAADLALRRERSATVVETRDQDNEPQMQTVRPRANTALSPAGGHSTFLIAPSNQSQQPKLTLQVPPVSQTPPRPTKSSPVSDSDLLLPSPQRIAHPYAFAFPSAGHRAHSRYLQPSTPRTASQERKSMQLLNSLGASLLTPTKNVTAQLRRVSSRNHLKGSVSTPNLRGTADTQTERPSGFATESARQPSTPTRWLSAETWCDALIFPRPRFRTRAAHVITPPDSPTIAQAQVSSIAHVATVLTNSSMLSPPPKGRVLKKKKSHNSIKGKDATQSKSVTPPLIISPPSEGPKKERPPRPKSFAQDDLALPSPVPSLATVLKEAEAFEQERSMWKETAARSFQNKRSRSLSRSRLKAIAKHSRSNSEEELATSFSALASTAFHGNQSWKPSTSIRQSSEKTSRFGTNSIGLNSHSTHSRKSSGASQPSKGHSRKESWGKTVVKTAKSTANATGLCAFAVEPSPVDEKRAVDDTSLLRDQTRHNRIDDQENDQRAAGGTGILLIAPHAQTQTGATLAPPSPSPAPSDDRSNTSHTGVGIALSTPTVLAAEIAEPFSFSDHPYASGMNRDDYPRPSEYAGPHPSHTQFQDILFNDDVRNDVSLRHRLPPSAGLQLQTQGISHPYATAEARPRPMLKVPTGIGNLPSASMFAQVGSGAVREVLPDEIQYSPYSPIKPSGSADKEDDELGVEEALSVAFSRGSMDDESSLSIAEPEEDVTAKSALSAQITTAVPAIRTTAHFRPAALSQIDEASVQDWVSTAPTEERHNSSLSVPQYHLHPSASSEKSKEASPGPMSAESSPVTSPRQFGTHDSEDFNDIFYKPGQQSSDTSLRRSPSSDILRTLSSREASGTNGDSSSRSMYMAQSRNASGSALMNLSRQLSEAYSLSRDDERHTFGGNTSPTSGNRSTDFVDMTGGETPTRPTENPHSSPPGAALPLRMNSSRPISLDPPLLIPEDVESSRASSILERSDAEDETVVYYRVGQVPALATPNPVSSPNINRVSDHGSYFGDLPRSSGEERRPTDSLEVPRPLRPSFVPPTATSDTTRASYVTSTSSASRISQLSDFPIPPSQDLPSVIQSHFPVKGPEERRDEELGDNSSDAGGDVRQSRRTTFGGEEPIQIPFDFRRSP